MSFPDPEHPNFLTYAREAYERLISDVRKQAEKRGAPVQPWRDWDELTLEEQSTWIKALRAEPPPRDRPDHPAAPEAPPI